MSGSPKFWELPEFSDRDRRGKTVITVPINYHPKLSPFELQRAIDYVKSTFQTEFSQALHLQRVSAPYLFWTPRD